MTRSDNPFLNKSPAAPATPPADGSSPLSAQRGGAGGGDFFSPDIRAHLEAPFAPGDHEFVQGNPYLKKQAIRRRLSAVDPRWSTTEPAILDRTEDVIVLRGGLTVLGVTRYAVGTGIIQRWKKDYKTDQQIELTGYDLARSVTRAYKYADSDLLPRCAVCFGLGAYLKDLPRKDGKPTVTNPQQLAAWLRTLNGGGS